jgi:hypothetical protein
MFYGKNLFPLNKFFHFYIRVQQDKLVPASVKISVNADVQMVFKSAGFWVKC